MIIIVTPAQVEAAWPDPDEEYGHNDWVDAFLGGLGIKVDRG